MLSQRGDDPFLDRPATGTTDRDAHAIVASQTVQLVHVVGGIPAAVLHLPGRRVQFGTAGRTVEVIPVVNFTPEAQWRIVDNATKKKE